MRSGKKFVRRWDYIQVALPIAGVRKQYESEDAFKSVRSDSLFGEVTKKIGLKNTPNNRRLLQTFWKKNIGNIQVHRNTATLHIYIF